MTTKTITIECLDRSHGRPQLIPRFQAVEPGMWAEVGAPSWDDRQRQSASDLKLAGRLLISDEALNGDLDALNNGRRRHGFKCARCGRNKPLREEKLFAKFDLLSDARPECDNHVIPLSVL